MTSLAIPSARSHGSGQRGRDRKKGRGTKSSRGKRQLRLLGELRPVPYIQYPDRAPSLIYEVEEPILPDDELAKGLRRPLR